MVKLVKPRAGPTADWCLDKSLRVSERHSSEDACIKDDLVRYVRLIASAA